MNYATSATNLNSSQSIDSTTKLDAFHEGSILKIAYVDNATGGTFGSSDGILLAVGVGSTWGHQIHLDDNNNTMWHRSMTGGGGAWNNWLKVIDSGNIGSQSVASSSYPVGFTSRGTSDWSGVSGTFATDWSVNGADIMFKYDGSKLNVITDGRFYQGIDIYGSSKRCLDEYDISNTTWGNADKVDGYHATDFIQKIWDNKWANGAYTFDKTGLRIEQASEETSGISFNGDYINMWSPADNYCIRYWDEDSGGEIWYISSGGYFSGSCNYANSAGSAGSVAWSNVSGRPTDLSSFSNGPGYITSGGSCAFASNTSFSRQYSKSGAGYIDTDISVNVYSGRCMLVLYTAHGGGGSTCGSRVYMLRCGSSDSYISVTTIATNTANDGLYSPSFSSNNGLLRIYNPYANGSFLVLFTNWV